MSAGDDEFLDLYNFSLMALTRALGGLVLVRRPLLQFGAPVFGGSPHHPVTRAEHI